MKYFYAKSFSLPENDFFPLGDWFLLLLLEFVGQMRLDICC